MHGPITIKFRKLTNKEIKVVMEEIRQTVNITGYTQSEWQKFEEFLVAEYNGELAGVAVIQSISQKWSELTVLLVLSRFRGRGIGNNLFRSAIEHIERGGKNVYTVSRNPIVIRSMQEAGFTFVSLRELPLEINLFNIKFILSWFRLKEYLRKKMYHRELPEFVYGVKVKSVV